MAIDFPGSPQLNEEFTSAGVTWKWDGQKWVSQSPGGGGGTGMPTGGGTPPEDAFYENTMVINDDYQITDGKNAGTFGPVTVNSTVTVPDGQTWTVVGGGEGGGGGGGGVTSIIAGEGISVDQPTGAVTITNTGGGGGPTTPGARYQSGTWTPAFCEPVSGNPGTSVTDVWPNTLATWVRVGNQVTISGYIRLTNVGDLTGGCALGGVPYPADDGYYGASRVFWQSLGEATVNAGLTITGHAPDAVNPSAMLLWQLPAASQNMSQAQYGTGVGSGSNFIFTITYFTDDTSFSPAETSDVNEDTQGIGGGGATGVRYQEGTWTPTSPIGTLTLQPERNYWSRIGNTVTLNGCIVGFSDNTSADLIRIQSIPYICEGGVAGVCYAGNIATSAGQINTCYTGDNSNEVQFSSSSNIKGNAQQVAKYSDINSTSGPFVWFTITYQTNNTTFDPGPGAVATVDIQGGGGSGGGSGSGADAWGNVNADGTKNGGGLNFADVNKVSEGVYEITFTTPMPNDQYSVTASVSPAGSGNQPVRMITAGEQTTAGFKVITTNGGSIADGTNASVKDYPFTFAVFASSTVTPTFTWTRDGTTLLPANDGDTITTTGVINAGNFSGDAGDTAGTRIHPNGWYGLSREASEPGTTVIWQAYHGTTRTSSITAAGTADFGGNITASGSIRGGDFASGRGFKGENIDSNAYRLGIRALNGVSNSNKGLVLYKGATVAWSVTYGGTASSRNVVLNLEPDNSDNYVSTTNAEGETESVYNGPQLDVRQSILQLQAAMVAINQAAESASNLTSLKTAIKTATADFMEAN